MATIFMRSGHVSPDEDELREASVLAELLEHCPTEIGVSTEAANKISRLTGCVTTKQILQLRRSQLERALTKRELNCLFQCLANVGLKVPGFVREFRAGSIIRGRVLDSHSQTAEMPYYPKALFKGTPLSVSREKVITERFEFMPKKATIKAVIGVSEEQYAAGPYLAEYSAPVGGINLSQFQFVVVLSVKTQKVDRAYLSPRPANSEADVLVFAAGYVDRLIPPQVDSVAGVKIEVSVGAEYTDFAPYICNMFTLQRANERLDHIIEDMHQSGDGAHVEPEAVDAEVDPEEIKEAEPDADEVEEEEYEEEGEEEGEEEDAEEEGEEEGEEEDAEEDAEEEEGEEEDAEEEGEEDAEEEDAEEEEGEEEEEDGDEEGPTYAEMCEAIQEGEDEDGDYEKIITGLCKAAGINPDEYETWQEVGALLEDGAEEEEVDLSDMTPAELKKYLNSLTIEDLRALAIEWGMTKVSVKNTKAKAKFVSSIIKLVGEQTE